MEDEMDSDAYILAMWFRFVLAPSTGKPDIDGAFDLGEVGSVRGRNWEKMTPYSVARVSRARSEAGRTRALNVSY